MQGTGDRWTLGHRPALDGVRGIAILLVLLCHMTVPGTEGAGAAGVTVFFVLSGFLITALLLEEHARTGGVSFRRFYERRARRLAPALIVSTAVVVGVAPIVGDGWFSWETLPPVLLYYANWSLAAGGELGGLVGTWSLAVEEQFYLAWPVVLFVAARAGRRALGLLVLVGVALSLLARANLIFGGASLDRIYTGTDSVAFALLAGCGLAVWAARLDETVRGWPWAVCGVVLLVAVCWWPHSVAGAFAPVPAAVAGVLLVVAATADLPPRLIVTTVLVWLGVRSYGLYLWHVPLSVLLNNQLGWSWPALVAVMLPVSLLLAEASYRWVEMPWRRRREAIQPGPLRPPSRRRTAW